MNTFARKSVLLRIFCAALLFESSLVATTYTLTDLGVLPGFATGRATAINNQGQIVRWCETTNDVSHGFLWENGRMKDLGTFGGSESLAEGINNSGEIVGAFISNGKRRAFLWQHGKMLDLGIVDDFAKLGDGRNWRPGCSINDLGQVGCRRMTENGQRMSTLWQNDHDVYFGLFSDGTACSALAINNSGQIVGAAHRGDSSLSHAFIWDAGSVVSGRMRRRASTADWRERALSRLIFSTSVGRCCITIS